MKPLVLRRVFMSIHNALSLYIFISTSHFILYTLNFWEYHICHIYIQLLSEGYMHFYACRWIKEKMCHFFNLLLLQHLEPSVETWRAFFSFFKSRCAKRNLIMSLFLRFSVFIFLNIFGRVFVVLFRCFQWILLVTISQFQNLAII